MLSRQYLSIQLLVSDATGIANAIPRMRQADVVDARSRKRKAAWI